MDYEEATKRRLGIVDKELSPDASSEFERQSFLVTEWLGENRRVFRGKTEAHYAVVSYIEEMETGKPPEIVYFGESDYNRAAELIADNWTRGIGCEMITNRAQLKKMKGKAVKIRRAHNQLVRILQKEYEPAKNVA